MDISNRTKQQYRTDRDADYLCESPPLPRNMMVELSNSCNHACAFCPNPTMSRKKGRIDSALMYRIMDEAAAAGVTEIGFYTTGEPFIHKELPEFTAYAKRAGFTYTYISTNGALATPDRAKRAIDAGMDSIKFSINAGSRETYRTVHGADDFDAVIANLRFISEYRKAHRPEMRLFVTCVVTRIMEHEVDSLREILTPLVDDISFNPCWALALPTPEEGGKGVCHLPFNRLHVTEEGYLTLCCVDYQNYVAVADLREMSLLEAWQSPTFREMRRRHLAGDLQGTFCGRCWTNDRGPVLPVVPAFATQVDFDEYDRIQRDRIERELMVPPAGC